jgi:hypothetical protein
MALTHHWTTLRRVALRPLLLVLACLLSVCGMPALALVFINNASVDASGNPTSFNATAPTGAYANSGWQYVGRLGGGILGVPIGPRHFIAAAHIGGGVGQGYTFGGASYTTVASFDDPETDLRIWQVDRDFPTGSWAPLFPAPATPPPGQGACVAAAPLAPEVTRELVVFGAGSLRGAAVQTARLNGWQWRASDGLLRWGTNRVESRAGSCPGGLPGTLNADGVPWIAFNGKSFQALYATFDQAAGTNEAQTAGGDSSAPIFIQDGATYKLAGVTAAVDCCFNTASSGSGFFAAIFDVRGLYVGSATGWILYSAPPCQGNPNCFLNPLPAGFYATRVSTRLSWINGILALQDQTIAFPAIPDRPLDQSPFMPSASASSGLPVTLSVLSGPATVNGNVVTLTGLGAVTLKAEQSGSATYRPATPVQQTFNVTVPSGGGSRQVPVPEWTAALLAAALAFVGLRRARPLRLALDDLGSGR